MLKYLARYTHRVAISNHRLRALENGRASFEWKDYAHQARSKLMTLDAVEFLRRFLMHVLPHRTGAHPSVRLPGQSCSQTQTGVVPRSAGGASTAD